MFAVIYQFKVKNNRDADFISAWKQLTRLIYKHEGSLGSRLHKQQDGVYLAYAQWPDKATWEQSGNTLPDGANQVREEMRAACSSIVTLHELEGIEDLLQSRTYQNKS